MRRPSNIHKHQQGFTLIEIAIVISVIGLLVGGAIAGRSLLRGAEIRSVMSGYQEIEAAVATFESAHDSLPGDFDRADDFWGVTAGNGNGEVDLGEALDVWNHLSVAGMLEANYPVAGGSNHNCPANCPASSITNSGYAYFYNGTIEAYEFAASQGHLVYFGAVDGVNQPDSPILKPTEAWGIDVKMDDGAPGRGKVLTFELGGAGNPSPNCSTTTNANTSQYDLDRDEIACMVIFHQGDN